MALLFLAITTSWNGVLIFISGLCFFEAFFPGLNSMPQLVKIIAHIKYIMPFLNIFLLIFLLGINLAAFSMVGWDKKRAINHSERSPEVYFFLLAASFGSLGVFLGMFTFRHKTQKFYFPLGIGLLLIEQTLLLFLIQKNYWL